MDMSSTIIAKSNQMNADDLIGGPVTIKVLNVTKADTKEQPISIHYQGDNGKPWKPCKSMCRVLVAAWGLEASAFIGRSLTLYRDNSVTWAGEEVGGIRISHMSHIEKPLTLSLAVKKGSKKSVTVHPLGKIAPQTTAPQPTTEQVTEAYESLKGQILRVANEADFKAANAEARRLKPSLDETQIAFIGGELAQAKDDLAARAAESK